MRTIKDYQKSNDKYLKQLGIAKLIEDFNIEYSFKERELIEMYLKFRHEKVSPLILWVGDKTTTQTLCVCPEDKYNCYFFIKEGNDKHQIWFNEFNIKAIVHNYNAAKSNRGADFYLAICTEDQHRYKTNWALLSNLENFIYKFEYEPDGLVSVKKYKRNKNDSAERLIGVICFLDTETMDKICNYIKTIYCL